MNLWSNKQHEFKPDGSLRDIYVYDVNKDVWESLINKIIESEYGHKFWHGEFQVNLPTRFSDIRKLQETDPTTLNIFLHNNIQVNCHFFVENEIEMDITPRDIDSEDSFGVLMSFLYWLSGAIGCNVHLTHENSPEQVILSVEQ